VRLAAAVMALALLSAASPARAEWRPSGSATAGALIRQGDLGFGGLVDLWHPVGVLRVGGAMGLGTLTSDNDDRTRIFMPLGASLAVVVHGPRVGFSARARAGLWGGALNIGLRAGAWLSGGATFDVWLDTTVAVTVGADVWVLLGPDDAVVVVPGIGLTWTLSSQA